MNCWVRLIENFILRLDCRGKPREHDESRYTYVYKKTTKPTATRSGFEGPGSGPLAASSTDVTTKDKKNET